MVQGVASLASHDGDIHIPGGGPRLIYVHISLGKIDLLSHFHYNVSLTFKFVFNCDTSKVKFKDFCSIHFSG